MSQDARQKQLSAGDRAPEFELVTADTKRFHSPDLLRKGPVLLTFYRGAWCACCQADFRDLMRAMPAIRKTRATVLGVFHHLNPMANAHVAREYALDFPLVNDVDGRAAQAFGIRSAIELAQIENELGPEVPALQEGQSWILPMQARFVIGMDGIVARSEILFDYDKRSNAKDLIPLLEGLG